MLILVVDDEAMIRQGIAAKVEAMNFPELELLFAADGHLALELIEQRDISIVLTDIKMFEMDGLELIRLARNIKPQLQFILISGYAEFTFAREAMAYGVQDYLLKPIAPVELQAALQRSFARLNEKKAIDSDKKRMTSYQWIENEQELFSTLNACVKQKKPTPELRRTLLSRLAAGESEPYLSLGLIRFYRTERGADGEQGLREFLRDYHFKSGPPCAFLYARDYAQGHQWWVLLLGGAPQALNEGQKDFYHSLERVCKDEAGLRFVLGFSAVSLLGEADFEQEAKDALSLRFKDKNTLMGVYEALDDEQSAALDKRIYEINEGICANDPASAVKKLDEIFSPGQIKAWSSPYIRHAWNQILTLVYNQAKLFAKTEYSLLEEYRAKMEQIDALDDMDALVERLQSELQNCRRLHFDAKYSSNDRILLAEKYLKEFFARDISLNEIASMFYMSPNYFSSLFKKLFNKTVSNYILAIRMQKAQEYLRNTERNVVDIAKDVGYEDTQYFFRLFKKETGETPLAYRRHHRKNDKIEPL